MTRPPTTAVLLHRMTTIVRLIPHFGEDEFKQFDGSRDVQLPAGFHQVEHIVIQFAPPRGIVLEFDARELGR